MLIRLVAVVRDRGDLFARLVLASLQIAFIAWFSPGRGLPLDDAWIHQVVARTFAETGTLGYAPGHHGAAATSYLWAALLAIDFKFLNLDAGRWALILNAISALVSGQLLYSLLVRARRSSSSLSDIGALEWSAASLAATAFACCSPNILWFVCSGMEAMPFIALSLTAIWASTDVGGGGRSRRVMIGGLSAGALAFLRPEAAPLGGLLAVHALVRMRDSRRATAVGVPWMLAVALYVVSNIAKTGHALPSTLAGRRWLWFEMSTGLSRTDRVFDFLDQWGTRLGSYTFDTSLAVVWIFVAIAAYGAFRLCAGTTAAVADAKRADDDGPRVLFAWALFHAAFYALLLPTSGHGGRYQPLTPLLFAACIPIGTALLLRELVRLVVGVETKSFLWFAAIGIAPWIGLASPVEASLREANTLAVAHIQATELDAGTYVASLPEGAIASFDIGGIGYAAKKRRILDLGGLSDPSTASLLENGRIWTWLESNKVRFIVLPASYEHVLPVFEDYGVRLHLRDNPALHLDAIRVFETPFDKWEPAIKATWNAAPKQIVYEVTYTSREGPREGVALLPPDAMREIVDPAGLIPRRERVVAEHMLATLAAWGMPVDVRVTTSATDHASASASSSSASSSSAAILTGSTAPAPTFDLASGGVIGGDLVVLGKTSGPCVVRLGSWGIAFEGGCGGDPVLRAIAYEHIGRYLDAGDLGGALRAIPHVLVQSKRRTDPRFHPPIAPLTPPIPNGFELLAMRSNGWGLVVFFAILFAAIGIETAARRDLRFPRLVRFLRTKLPSPPAAVMLGIITAASVSSGCGGRGDSDVTRATSRGRGAVEIAIANGGDVNEVPGSHRVPLLAAAVAGDPEVISLLLERGARLEVITFDGGSPLHVAARHNHHAAVSVIANAMALAARKTAAAGQEREAIRASLSLPAGPRARTALHDAAANGSIETVTALLAAGADATKADSFGQTPLHLIASTDATKSAFLGSLLINAGADPRALDARGFSPLHAAVVADNTHLARTILQHRGSLVEERTTTGESPLDLALRYERDRVADMLTRNGATLTRPDAWPPLHDAARLDAVVRVANLIASGADTERRFRNKTALEIAQENGSRRVVALLLRGDERPK